MFQAWEVNTANTDAASRPSSDPGNRARKNVTVTARKPRIGTDCRMSRAGIITRRARRFRAAT